MTNPTSPETDTDAAIKQKRRTKAQIEADNAAAALAGVPAKPKRRAKAAEDDKPVRFVHVGASSGSDITLPGAALRSSAILLMGSGIKSVPLPALLDAVRCVYDAFVPASLGIATTVVPIEAVQQAWNDESNSPRIVFTIGR